MTTKLHCEKLFKLFIYNILKVGHVVRKKVYESIEEKNVSFTFFLNQKINTLINLVNIQQYYKLITNIGSSRAKNIEFFLPKSMDLESTRATYKDT